MAKMFNVQLPEGQTSQPTSDFEVIMVYEDLAACLRTKELYQKVHWPKESVRFPVEITHKPISAGVAMGSHKAHVMATLEDY